MAEMKQTGDIVPPKFKSLEGIVDEGKIKAELEAVEKRNREINERIKSLGDSRAEIDRQIAGLRDEAVKTIGAYEALKKLSEPDETTH